MMNVKSVPWQLRMASAVLALGSLLAAGLSPSASAQNGPLLDLASFPRTTLEIVSGAATHRFSVWVADTEPRKEQGLMFVRDLPPDQGMLFTHCCTGIWMRNTYIELDIVFVGADGKIITIAPHARPFDETTIKPASPADAVVELKGGEAERLKLKAGDRVHWSPPGPAEAAAAPR
jgi:uncharacterized protein